MTFEEWWTEEREDMAHSGCGQALLGERDHWKHVVHSAYKLGFEEGAKSNKQINPTCQGLRPSGGLS